MLANTPEKFIKLCFILVTAAFLSACAGSPATKDYTYFRDAGLKSLLVVPVVNHSEEVDAPDFFLTTIPVPLAEKGYYVFPINMVKTLMEEDGLNDPFLVHSAETTRVADLFGADAVLYVEILSWKAEFIVIASNIRVEFLYTLKDGKTGTLLWQEQEEFVQSSGSNSGNILADVVANAITSAINNVRSDYTPVAVAANTLALIPAGTGIPAGPYSPEFGKDQEQFPASGTGVISDATTVAVSYPDDATRGNE
jgi:hypothetical protein